MQAINSTSRDQWEPRDRKDDKDHKMSKFAEGRLKLSTSCTECHRRKQKCDQKQPCRQCSRRFPPPQCVYKTIKDLTPSNEGSSSRSNSENAEEAELSRPPLSTIDNNKSKANSEEILHDFNNGHVMFEDLQFDKHVSTSSLSPDSLDEFGPSEYQDLLTTMVSNITGDVLSGSVHSGLSDDPDELNGDLPNSMASTVGEYPNGLALVPLHQSEKSYPQGAVDSPSRFSISVVDPLHFLGITPTYQSGELLQAFLKVITKYVVSIDGSPKPNYYNDIWVPWAMKSPLLAYMGVFTASCYQSEAQKIPPQKSAIVLGYKLKTIRLLNAMLRDKDKATCNEAITAVMYLMTNEWYWSNYDNVQAHLKGLTEMVRLRGGLGELGMNGFLRQMILLVDYHIACSYDIEPAFPHNIASHVRYPAPFSTPLLYSTSKFASVSSELDISPETAAILDDMRFVTMAVLKLLNTSQTDDDLIKLFTTSRWIQTRILALPDGNDPTHRLARDNIYKSCRIAALIYCRAIVERTPLAKACTLMDLNMLWASMWRVTLTRWKQIPGILVWVILSGNQAAQDTPHGRFLKSIFKATTSYIGLEHFDVVDAQLMTYIRLQRWLRMNAGEGSMRRGSSGDEDKPRARSFLHNYNN